MNHNDILGIKVYRNDTEVVRVGARSSGGGKRGKITEFSEASRARLAFIASNTDIEFKTLVTLTYPREFSSDGKQVKRDLKSFLKRAIRRWGQIDYLWFFEFQARGAPHYHILLSNLHGHDDKGWLSRAWYDIVGSEDERHLRAGTRIERIRKSGARYAVKYGSKMRQKEVPEEYQNCGRFFGYSKAVKPDEKYHIKCDEGMARRFLGGSEYADRAIEMGYRVIYNSAGSVMQNVILLDEYQNEHQFPK